jgi:hypothetical protein
MIDLANLTGAQEFEKNKKAVKQARIAEVTSLIVSYNLTLDDIEDYLDTPTASEKLSYFNREYTKSETQRALAARAQEARKIQAERDRTDKEIKRLEKELKLLQEKRKNTEA